VDMYLSIC